MLNKVRSTTLAVEPQMKEAIKVGMPTFVLFDNIAYFAAHTNHLSGLTFRLTDVSQRCSLIVIWRKTGDSPFFETLPLLIKNRIMYV